MTSAAAGQGQVPRLVVIGGGPAGFMCAVEAARAARSARTNLEVVVLEATSKVLGKVKISGGGRCNVLHDETKGEKLISEGYPRGDKPLLSAFSRFGPSDTAAWFRAEGVVLKTEADGRMFPVTDRSETIIEALSRAADAAQVQVRTGQRVDALLRTEDGRFLLKTSTRDKSKDTVDADFVLLSPGSSRLAHVWAEGLGHELVPAVPSLFTFECRDLLLQGLAGLSVQDAEVALPFRIKGRRKTLRERGPVLVTHTGLSGPAILRLSAFGAREMHEAKYESTLTVNWLPDLQSGEASAVKEMEGAKRTHSEKLIAGASGPTFGLPRRMFQALAMAVGIPEEAKWGHVKDKNLRRLAASFVRCELNISGKGAFKEEFVTAGGVSLKSVDMKTLESKSVPGLYFAGEVLDVDGITGGDNLQAAWTTGCCAGRAIAAAAAATQVQA